MKILVTGGAGFIGSHLVDRLLAQGHSVRIFDNLDSQVHPNGAPPYLNGKAEFIKGDVREADAFGRALEGVEAVYHYAAAVGVSQSQYCVRHYTDVNIGGTANLFDLIVNRKLPIRTVVIPGSMTSYGEGAYLCTSCGRVRPKLRSEAQAGRGEWEPVCPLCGNQLSVPQAITEEDSFFCNSVYGITKRDQEELALLMNKLYGIPVVVFRYFNVYGPRQSLSNPYTGVISIFLSRVKNGNRPHVYEDGMQTRDFVHVSDVVDVNLRVLDFQAGAGRVYNIGTGIASKIGDIARLVCRRCTPGIEPEITGQFRKGDTRHCYPDITRAARELGFVPKTGLEAGLEDLLGWAAGERAQDAFEKAHNELIQKGLA